MKVQAGYREGHLVVAAVRVLAHRADGRPPTVDEIKDLLGISGEWAGVLVRSLEASGVVRQLQGPFETRVEIADHLALEDLPREEADSSVDEELKEFTEKKRREDERLRQLFSSDAQARQNRKLTRLEEDLKKFHKKEPGSRASSLFDPEPSDPDD